MTAGYRKSPRLKEFDYIGPLVAHVIIVARQRRPMFIDESLAAACLQAIQASIGNGDVQLHAYCLMPDHVHLLLEVGAGVSLEKVVHSFKTRSGFILKQMTKESSWQTSYYDHILRKEEALSDVAAYIWANPVAAGLVAEFRDYRWSGPRESMPE